MPRRFRADRTFSIQWPRARVKDGPSGACAAILLYAAGKVMV